MERPLTSVGDRQADRTGIHTWRVDRQYSGKDGDESACKGGQVVEDPVALPKVPETAPVTSQLRFESACRHG